MPLQSSSVRLFAEVGLKVVFSSDGSAALPAYGSEPLTGMYELHTRLLGPVS